MAELDVKLVRMNRRADGIFSDLLIDGERAFFTLDHAYPLGDEFVPKLYAGTFRCVRSSHRLHGMTHDFETFEITGVDGHNGILFHWGNFNANSEGCVLLGEHLVKADPWMVGDSKRAFAAFMERMDGIDEFDLVVEENYE